MINHAHPTPSSAAASTHAPASRPLELLEARRLRDLIAALLRREQAAMAEALPAAVRRAVWERDAGRCAWPLDSGACCGSTHRLEFDHIEPWARWGKPTEANLPSGLAWWIGTPVDEAAPGAEAHR